MDPNTQENPNPSTLPDVGAETPETPTAEAPVETNGPAPEFKAPPRPNFYEENSIFLRNLHESVTAEVRAAERSNPDLVPLIQDTQTALDILSALASARTRGDGQEIVKVQDMLRDYFQIIGTILNGGILTPLAGTEDEWEDVPLNPNTEKSFTVDFRGKTYTIEFKSVQVNKRFPKIFRFNKDTRLAHREDLVRVFDAKSPGYYFTTKVSRRFIKFPYTLETVSKAAEMSEDGKSVVCYTDGTEQDILDEIAFKVGDKVLLAPPVPVHMLKKDGIDIDAELAKV